MRSINRDSINGENCLKLTNEIIIFPYVTIIDSSINRENLQESQNKIFPINGTQLYICNATVIVLTTAALLLDWSSHLNVDRLHRLMRSMVQSYSFELFVLSFHICNGRLQINKKWLKKKYNKFKGRRANCASACVYCRNIVACLL